MNPYIITYDLNKPGQNYDHLEKELENLGHVTRIQRSTWVLEPHITEADSTDAKEFIDKICSIDSLYNELEPYLDPNDQLLIAEAEEYELFPE